MRQYSAERNKFTTMGGETCTGSAGANIQMRTGCSAAADESNFCNPGGAVTEGAAYYFSYLNTFYAQNFITSWINGGCYNTIGRLLGYRFQLDSITHAASVARGANLLVEVDMRNYGWARIHSHRRLKIRLVNGGNVIEAFSFAQLRQLPMQATSSSKLLILLSIPTGATTGSYAVDVEMPDTYTTTESIRRYKIRPANANNGSQIWDDTNGRFATGTSVTIT